MMDTVSEPSLQHQLVFCLQKTLDPLTPHAKRAGFYQKIEDFKETNPRCIECGFQLARQEGSPEIRHFGLQLLDYSVKYRWKALSPSDHQEFKQQVLQFLAGVCSAEQEALYVKESMARLTVEVAKRMWPQFWESFLPDLDVLSRCGPAQVQIVLMILRRLKEDLLGFDNTLTSQRRREMNTALNEQMDGVFTFLVNNVQAPQIPCLRHTALSALTSYVEGVEWRLVLMNDCTLIQLLCALLAQQSDVQVEVSECLLNILARKGEPKRTSCEREKLVSALLSKDALTTIVMAAENILDVTSDEQRYIFLKRVCQILVHLGTSQLAPLWNTIVKFSRPENFNLYLLAVLGFTKHNSQVLALTAADVWNTFLVHTFIKEDGVFLAILPQVLSVLRQKLMRVGDPSLSNHPSCLYNKLDFDSLEEYNYFFSKYRSCLHGLVHHIALLIPSTVANEVLTAVKEAVCVPTDSACTKTSDAYYLWEGLASFIEPWAGSLKAMTSLKESVKDQGVAIIQQLLSYETHDPLILSSVLKCLQGGLNAFLQYSTELILPCLNKILFYVVFTGGAPDKHHLAKDVSLVRHMATTALLHICESHTLLLQPHLEALYLQYKVFVDCDVLQYAEKSAFLECFMVLSRPLAISAQGVLISELLQEANRLVSDSLHQAATSVEGLVAFLGFNQNPTSPMYPFGARAKLTYVAHNIQVVVKRSVVSPPCPDLPSNPSWIHVEPLLRQYTLPLIRSLHQLYADSSRPLLSPFFQKLNELHSIQRDGVIGCLHRKRDSENDELGSSQLGLVCVHEHCIQTLHLALEVYHVQSLIDIGFVCELSSAIFSEPMVTSNLMMKTILRGLILPLLKSCPPQCWDSVLIPLFCQVGWMAYNRLEELWRAVPENGVTPVEEDYQDEEEVKEEVFHQQLAVYMSKEYVHLLEVACLVSTDGSVAKPRQQPEGGCYGDVVMDEESQSQDLASSQPHSSQPSSCFVLSPFATRMVQDQDKLRLLLISAFKGLTWNDSSISLKCTNIASALLDKTTLDPGVYEQLFYQVITGLQKHGMYDNSRDQLLNVGMKLYQRACPEVDRILLGLKGNTPIGLKEFTTVLSRPVSPRQKREAFRKLLETVIVKHLNEAYRKPAVVLDLPEKIFKKKEKGDSAELVTDLSSLFQEPS